ncbi:MAG: 2-hydroxyacyl-CoA dehydratase, partial [Oscillospiraceae bacterium]|nr:2-hydroxyacyl-CoA dehydratase [Oscillospiraceae bacterium]
CFENCSGYKAAFQMVDAEADDILEAIARRYLEIGCSVMTPNNKRLELLPELIKEFKADCIVDITLQACITYNIESSLIRKMASNLGIPFLSLETDYSAADTGQLETRLEAFLEML